MSLKLADHSTIQPVGFVEAIPVKIEGIYIPADFMVFDNEEDPDVRILLGRPFLATAGAIIDVKNGRIGFQVSDEMVGFELENIMKGPALYSSCMIKDNDVKERFLASSTQYDLFDPMKGFENFTYEFLSSITFKKDRLNFDNPNHRVSFRLLNIDYEMSLENFCLEMGFANAGFIHDSWNHDLKPKAYNPATFWERITGLNNTIHVSIRLVTFTTLWLGTFKGLCLVQFGVGKW